MSCLAFDIGGANVKAATADGYAASRPFALWRTPQRLAEQLRDMIAAAPSCSRIAATMTGELADCFETKADGVHTIVEAVQTAAAGRQTAFYATEGTFLSAAEASDQPLAIAASNWHALAMFAARWVSGSPALLIDIGSTTVDLIPLDAGASCAIGRTDLERLRAGELCYTGVERTPVASIVSDLPWRGARCPVASEMFARSNDAHLLLGDLPEEPENRETADGRPRTRPLARARLARMICADATLFSESDALAAAAAIRDAQLEKLSASLVQVLARENRPPAQIIVSGHGEFLARRLVKGFPWGSRPPALLSLNEALGPLVSRCAPAYAVALLANERFVADNVFLQRVAGSTSIASC